MIKQVKLGSVPYKIVRGTPVLSDEGDKVLWGEILQGKQVIKVDSQLAPEMQRVVLLHEVMHGLLIHCGLSDHVEELPERLGYALDTFLVDNPEFVALYAGSPFKNLEAPEAGKAMRSGDFVYVRGDAGSLTHTKEADRE